MFCASIFNLRGLISLEMISMPLALTEKWREREALWVSCGVILEADVCGDEMDYSTTSINFNI